MFLPILTIITKFDDTFGAKNVGLILFDGNFGAKDIVPSKFEDTFGAKNIGLTLNRSHDKSEEGVQRVISSLEPSFY